MDIKRFGIDNMTLEEFKELYLEVGKNLDRKEKKITLYTTLTGLEEYNKMFTQTIKDNIKVDKK
mgnify:CR=1 FL=1